MNTENEYLTIWDNCLRLFGEVVEPQKFQTWFKPLRPVSFEGSTLTVEVPSDFFREYLEEMYLDLIKMTLKRVIGANARLVYKLHPVHNQAADMTYPAAHTSTPINKPLTVNTYSPQGNPGAIVYPGIKRLKINPRLNPAYCFGNMVEGDCNIMGVKAGQSIAKTPGNTPFNPLFVFGGPGLGKTHLLQAIGIAIKDAFPDKVVLYVTGNEFKIQYMDAVVVRNKLTDFLAFYMKMDVLIVDDIQDLMGNATQNAFFNIFNHLHENGKQLIFSSDRPAADLQNFEARLLSRLKWGLSVELTPPDYKTRLEMLRSKAFRDGVRISDEVLEYLSGTITSNFRELEGALISLVANATLAHRDITLELAQKVTENLIGEPREQISMDTVTDTVCEYFSISRDSLLSNSRKRQIVQARQIAMYMSRNLLNCSLSTIGAELGGKDHATVVHACTTVQNLIDTDKNFRQYIQEIEKLLGVSPSR